MGGRLVYATCSLFPQENELLLLGLGPRIDRGIDVDNGDAAAAAEAPTAAASASACASGSLSGFSPHAPPSVSARRLLVRTQAPCGLTALRELCKQQAQSAVPTRAQKPQDARAGEAEGEEKCASLGPAHREEASAEEQDLSCFALRSMESLLPHTHDTDGFFIAVLERVE